MTRQHHEFDTYNDFDIPLSCLDGEMTHWEGWIHVVIDIANTPSGIALTNFDLTFDPAFFVQRANGVRYYPVNYPTQEHHTVGPVTVIAGESAGVFRSDDGDTLPLGFHAEFVFDTNGNPVLSKFVGACP